MTKDELIVKQQLEIKELNEQIEEIKSAVSEASNCLWKPEQWSTKCPDFPKVAMEGIISARTILNDIY